MTVKRERKIKIPIRFKEQLSERFNIKNAVEVGLLGKHYKISIPCPLCKEYKCKDCPFNVVEPFSCITWLRTVTKGKIVAFCFATVWWRKADHKKAREILEAIRAKAEREIKWI